MSAPFPCRCVLGVSMSWGLAPYVLMLTLLPLFGVHAAKCNTLGLLAALFFHTAIGLPPATREVAKRKPGFGWAKPKASGKLLPGHERWMAIMQVPSLSPTDPLETEVIYCALLHGHSTQKPIILAPHHCS